MLAVTCLLGTACLCGCPGGLPQQFHRGGKAQGGVDIRLKGEHVTDEYSVNITGCEHDEGTHELVFSGGEMAAYASRTVVALRVSDAAPLRIAAFRKGHSLAFTASGCSTASLTKGNAGGELNLSCNQDGSGLTATIRFSQCGSQ